MKLILLIMMFVLTLTNAENSLARKKGHYGINGIIYKSGLMSLVTFLAIKAKVIIVLTVAFVIFVVGAKVWATFKYGNLLFDKGCHSYSHDGIVIPHPPTSYGHEFITSSEYEGFTPGYGYEKYSNGR